MFFPHRIGLQHTDHISFNKGCYRGQEIIARMHYRAQLKHEVRVLTMECADKIAVCDVIISQSSHEKIGEIIDYCQLDQDKYRLLISVLIHHTGDVYLTKP